MILYEMFEQQEELTLVDALRDFLPIVIKHLKLTELPKIHLARNIKDTHVPTFGRFENEPPVVTVNIENRHPNDILRTLAHELVHYAQGTRGMLDSDSWQTGSPEEDEANAEAGVIMRQFNTEFPKYLRLGPVILPQQVNEKWSEKYKRSIDCSNPKGFSQRAHCQGRKKANEDTCETHKSPSGRTTNMCPNDDDYEINYGKDALDEGFANNALLVAALASALASSPAIAEPNAAAQAIGIARKINIMKGYGAEGARAEAYQELYNLMKAVRGEGSNQSKIYPLVKDMINAPGPLPTEVEQLPPLTDEPINENYKAGKNVTEAFNAPYSLTWEHNPGESHDAWTTLQDGTTLSIRATRDDGITYDPDDWSVEFYRDNTQSLTAQGDAQRIFATVLAFIQEVIKLEKPVSISFSAEKEIEPGVTNPSRANLYTRLVQRYAASWGYSSKVNDTKTTTIYKLHRIANENFADGKKPGRKGLAKRVGVDCSQSISKLRSIAKSSSGERQRMAHWCANMKSGKNK